LLALSILVSLALSLPPFGSGLPVVVEIFVHIVETLLETALSTLFLATLSLLILFLAILLLPHVR
jgi:hypothetical protein